MPLTKTFRSYREVEPNPANVGIVGADGVGARRGGRGGGSGPQHQVRIVLSG